MPRRAFFPHTVDGVLMVSERVMNRDGSISYRPVMRLPADGASIVERYGGDLSDNDNKACREVVAQFHDYRSAIEKAGAFDFLALAQLVPLQQAGALVALQRLWADYAAATMVYCRVADDYLEQPPETRVRAELSLDLYRKALSFHDLRRAQMFLDDDLLVLATQRLSSHHRECIYDALFYLARRSGRRHQAYNCMQRAWQARPNADRTAILVMDAAYFKQSENVIRYASHLATQQTLSPTQLAQLTVAYARMGDMRLAKETLSKIKVFPSREARSLVAKVDAFLTGLRDG